MNTDFALYGVHAAFWATFGLERLAHVLFAQRLSEKIVKPPLARQEFAARFSRMLVAFHGLAFVVWSRRTARRLGDPDISVVAVPGQA